MSTIDTGRDAPSEITEPQASITTWDDQDSVHLWTDDNGELQCSITEDGLKAIRSRARNFVKSGFTKGYKDFPMNKPEILSRTMTSFFTEENICQVIIADDKITPANHNKKRESYRSSRLKPRDAMDLGLIGKTLPIKADCQEGYDWANSPHFSGVSKCSDITRHFKIGLPVSMYATPMKAKEAQEVIEGPDNIRFLSDYVDSTPTSCNSKHSEKGEKASLYAMKVVGQKFRYIISAGKGEGLSYWNLVKNCTTDSGTDIIAKDLEFDNGFRIYFPLSVEYEGSPLDYTLIISSVAAAADSWLAAFVTEQHAYERYLGAEFAKKILLRARNEGWEVKK